MAVLTTPKTQQMFETGEELPPKGTFIATCIDIKDVFGVERKKFQSEETEKVDLTAFLFGFRDRQGRPFKVASRSFKITGHEKSGLHHFLKAWLGEAPKMGWDYMELKGRKALITVEQMPSTRNPGQVYANIASISPLPDGMTELPPASKPQAAPPPAPVPPAAPAAEPSLAPPNDELPF